MMSTAVDADTKTALATAANEARGLAMDSIAAAHSGHMGLPLGAAEIGAVLYGSQVRRCCPGQKRPSLQVFISHFSAAPFYLYR
jgi:transketolase N-terminal domain/subunit